MDSKDLRIGNFIRLKENGNIFDVKVVGTRCESIDVYNNGIYTSYLKNIDYYLEPIPLTESWAIKFGYEDLIDMAISFCKECKYYGIEITSEDLRKIKVHEAQNLYFDLTGHDLTIK